MKNASVIPPVPNVTKTGWYEDSLLFMLDLSEGGLFSGVFIPPPPRPIFLDGAAKPDDFTACDLCSWAWKRSEILKTESTFEIPNQVEWLFSLVIVSIISASLGAIAMIIFFHCKRSKSMNSDVTNRSIPREPTTNIALRPPLGDPADKEQIPTIVTSDLPSLSNPSEKSVWCWLSKKTSGPTQLETITCSPVENHYTQMEEPYSNEEALYAELDMESPTERDNRGSEPYQNHAYADPDMQVSSAPSSAYYSDLSVTPIPEQAYEVVNLATMNVSWDNLGGTNKQSMTGRLAAISEHVSVPSDYV